MMLPSGPQFVRSTFIPPSSTSTLTSAAEALRGAALESPVLSVLLPRLLALLHVRSKSPLSKFLIYYLSNNTLTPSKVGRSEMDLYPLACPWSFLTGDLGRLGSRRLEGRREQRRWLALLVSLQCGVFSYLSLDSPTSPSRVKWQHSAPFSAGQRRALSFLYSQALLVCRTDFSGLAGGRSTLATTLSQMRPVVGYASAPDLFPQPVGVSSSSDPCKHNNILHHSNARSIHSRKRVSPPLLHVTSPSPLGQESGNQVSGGSSASSSIPRSCPPRRSPPPL